MNHRPKYPIRNRREAEEYFNRVSRDIEGSYSAAMALYDVPEKPSTLSKRYSDSVSVATTVAMILAVFGLLMLLSIGGLDPEANFSGHLQASGDYNIVYLCLGFLLTLAAAVAVLTDLYWITQLLMLGGRIRSTVFAFLLDVPLLVFACWFFYSGVAATFLTTHELPFDADRSRYEGPFIEEIAEDPYIRGKVLYYWWDGDESIGMMPMMTETLLTDTLLAPNSENEVGTVVWVYRHTERVGSYTRGGGAYREVADFRIVDLKRSAIIYEGTRYGKSPRTTLFGGRGTDTGDLDRNRIPRFVNDLPRIALEGQ